MTEYSQTYWNELLEQYRDGSISNQNRFQLEKQALDDPFLFDALEGFTLYDSDEEASKPKNKKKGIFTLPRIAAAAALVFLVTSMVVLKNNSSSNMEMDGAFATVLEDIEEEIPTKQENLPAATIEKSPVVASTPKESNDDVSNSASNIAVEAPMSAKEAPEKNETEIKQPKISGAIDAQSSISQPAKDIVEEVQIGKDEMEDEINIAEVDDEIAEGSTAKQESKEVVDATNANTFDTNSQNEGAEMVAVSTELGQLKRKVKKTKNENATLLYHEALPVIGKKIFDDYAKERIDQRGLRQEKPQEVTIEFSIDANGNLTNFHHIFTGCSECGPFAISILQNSGEWKTVPPGFSGKARYTFIF